MVSVGDMWYKFVIRPWTTFKQFCCQYSLIIYLDLKDQLLPYLKYKDKNEAVECSICATTFPEKDDLFNHLKSIHKSEIMEKLDSDSRKKRFIRSAEHISKMMDIVKSQCGNHSIKSMAELLKMPKATVLKKVIYQRVLMTKQI